jgi:rhamnulokinase
VSVRVAAVDLGASSGRVFAACIGEDEFTIEEVARFPNGAMTVLGTLYWDILALYRGMLEGIRATGRSGPLDGVGIDSWAVDFGLIDASGALLGNPVHHRDKRSAAGVEIAHRSFSAADLYGRTGIAHQRFNTVFQLAAIARSPQAAIAERLLLIPDLLTYWLTGEMGMEVTNASTTGLLSAHALEWEIGLLTGLSISPSLFPPLRAPGERAGMIHPEVLGELGISAAVPVIAVASHDTGSAVVGVPATTDRFAYISCGTWSLVGVELDHVVVTDASRAANFTNERGLDGTNRFLRNVMGLWLLQEAVRTWERAGGPVELPALLARSASVPAFRSVFDPDDERFLEPGDMPRRIAEVCVERGEPVPVTPEEVTRAILDSLALAYARAVHEAEDLAGTVVETVHLVGGGTQNALLCQLTADAVGVPVVAGPVEAAAIGNAIVQARALGAIGGDLPALRAGFARHVHVARYEPSPEVRSQASAAAQRFGR